MLGVVSQASAAEGIDASDVYEYQGKDIGYEAAAAAQLFCLQEADANRCFDTAEEVDAAAQKSESTTNGSGGIGPQAACDFNSLFEWKWPNMNPGPGPVMTLAARFNFYNYAAANDNTTTSFNTGAYPAEFAGMKNGAGNWYQGPRGTCAYQPNLGTWNGGISNNAFSSRFRH